MENGALFMSESMTIQGTVSMYIEIFCGMRKSTALHSKLAL